MGNSIAAFEIFDTKFCNSKMPHLLTLRDQYYFIKSAIDFLEPFEYILSLALIQVELEGNYDNCNRYYAGQLYYLNNNLDIALEYFNKCENFLPAAYAKMAIYKAKNDDLKLNNTAIEIEKMEDDGVNNYHFINGITPLNVEKGQPFEMVYNQILEITYYYELIEEINDVRILLGNENTYSDIGFDNLLHFESALQNEIDIQYRLKEFKEVENEMIQQLRECAKKLNKAEIYKEIFYNKEAHDLFKEITADILVKPIEVSIEYLLALRIHKPVIELSWYHKIILYFYLDNELDIETTLRLWLYTIKINSMGSGYKSLSKEENKNLSFGIDLFAVILHLPIKLIYKTFYTVFKITHLNLEEEKTPINQTTDYGDFENNYYENIGFMIEVEAKKIKTIFS